jgi:hypothetical protein
MFRLAWVVLGLVGEYDFTLSAVRFEVGHGVRVLMEYRSLFLAENDVLGNLFSYEVEVCRCLAGCWSV